MKIVRLTENNVADAYFDNVFNDEINLPPFSEVALASCAININPHDVIVSDANAEIFEDSVGSFILTHGTYNLENYETLLFDIESKMNDRTGNLLYDDNPMPSCGRQWSCSTDSKKTGLGDGAKVVIGYRCANYDGAAAEAYAANQVTVSVPVSPQTKLDATVKRNAGTPGDADATLSSKEPLTWGAGRFYINLNTLADPGNTNEGIFIGLTTTDHAKDGTDPTIEECVIGIHASRPGEAYSLNQGGVYYDDDNSGDGAENLVEVNDYIGFERRNGAITPVQYTAGTSERLVLAATVASGLETVVEYFQEDYDSDPLYPVIIMLGSATEAIADRVQFSPNAMSLHINNTYTPETASTLGVVGLQNNGQDGDHYIQFDYNNNNSSISRYLGFATDRIPVQGNKVFKVASAFYQASNVYANAFAGKGFYVELMTGTCEGYDGETGQRKNILAVIPESDSDDKLLFQPSFPIFLEMNNSHPLVLRNIRARVLQVDGTQLSVTGFNSLTLLFKPGKSQ